MLKSVRSRLPARFPLALALILLWVVPLLLLLHSGEQSLMAHDEGLYATRARQMLDSHNWIHPWEIPHHKTPGSYWILAVSMVCFGVTEAAVRLPSGLCSLLSAGLLWAIARRCQFSAPAALFASLCLSTSPLWLRYSHLGTPDLPFITLSLLGIWALLQAEAPAPLPPPLWSLIAGLSLGLTFLVRSFMAALPALVLLPYLVLRHRHHRHLSQPSLYVGLGLGLLPTGIWLVLVNQQLEGLYGQSLVDFVLHLGGEQRQGHSLFYYVWNMMANAAPWSVFALVGLGQTLKIPALKPYRPLLLWGPLLLALTLSLFATRLPHYSLMLYPFVALWAGLGLDALSQAPTVLDRGDRRWRRGMMVGLGGLGLGLLGGAGAVGLGWLDLGVDRAQANLYAGLGLILGVSWLGAGLGLGYSRQPSPGEARSHTRPTHPDRPPRRSPVQTWVISLLLGQWLALALASAVGLFSNVNPDLKALLRQPPLPAVLDTETIHFIGINGKTDTLLRFYTPHLGLRLDNPTDLPPHGYAWISPDRLAQFPQPYQIVGASPDLTLIQW